MLSTRDRPKMIRLRTSSGFLIAFAEYERGRLDRSIRP